MLTNMQPMPVRPVNAGELFEERLDEWQAMLKELIKCLKELGDVNHAAAKGSAKAVDALNASVPEASHPESQSTPRIFGSGHAGIRDVLSMLQGTAREQVEQHERIAQLLEEHAIAPLDGMYAQTKEKRSEVKAQLDEAYDALCRERDAFDEASRDYTQALERQHRDGEAYDGSDPWLNHREMHVSRVRVIEHETAYRARVNEQRDAMLAFECALAQKVKQALMAYVVAARDAYYRTDAQFDRLQDTVNAYDVANDWKSFEARTHAHPLVVAPMMASQSTEPLRLGTVRRRTGKLFYTWSDVFLVATTTGYLHGFRDAEAMRCGDEPEFSMLLNRCKLGAHSLPDRPEHSFRITELASGGDTAGSSKSLSFFRKKSTATARRKARYLLQATDRAEMLAWWSLLAEHVGIALRKSISNHPGAFERNGSASSIGSSSSSSSSSDSQAEATLPRRHTSAGPLRGDQEPITLTIPSHQLRRNRPTAPKRLTVTYMLHTPANGETFYTPCGSFSSIHSES